MFSARSALNRRAAGGQLDLQQSMMSCLLKIISIKADGGEAFVSKRVHSWLKINGLSQKERVRSNGKRPNLAP